MVPPVQPFPFPSDIIKKLLEEHSKGGVARKAAEDLVRKALDAEAKKRAQKILDSKGGAPAQGIPGWAVLLAAALLLK